MKEQLYIPKKLKVGYQKRDDTYTKKLGYVIYYDDKNVLRKEKSWEGWRDKKLTPLEVENKPTEGFVLNKGAGGKAGSWDSWNVRNEVVRVWDPRDFEFEISIPNMLFILTECDCMKGKGLSGEFVYAWDGPKLVLLPASCEDYKKASKFTDLQSGKVAVKDLVAGGSYKTKRQEDYIYLGKFPWHTFSSVYDRKNHKYLREHKSDKMYIFIKDKQLYPFKSLASFAEVTNAAPVSNYAELMDVFTKSKYSSPIADIVSVKTTPTVKPMTEQEQAQSVEHGSYYSRYYQNKIEGKFYAASLSGSWMRVSFNPEWEHEYKRRDDGGQDIHYKFVGWSVRRDHEISFKNGKLDYTEVPWEHAEEYTGGMLGFQKKKKLYSLEDIQKMDLYKLFIKTGTARIPIDKYI